VQILSGRRFAVHALAFSHCGRWLAAGGRGGVHLWDTTAPAEKPRVFPADKAVWVRPEFRTDGRLVWYDLYAGLRTAEPETVAITECGKLEMYTPVISRNGTRMIDTFGVRTSSVWELRATEPAVELWKVPKPAAKAARFSTDGTLLAIAQPAAGGSSAHMVSVWDATTGSPQCALLEPAIYQPQLAFSANNDFLLAQWSALIACWNLAEPEAKPTRIFNPSRKHFVALAIHPEGRALTVDNERLVRVWDVPSLSALRTIEWDIGKLYAVAVSADGTRAAVGSHTGRVLVWDWD
jgi:WD40 repeat protein